jgi:cytochrome c oxidase cbb3-type subunit 1
MNFFGTTKGNATGLDANVALRFTYVGLFFWIIAGVQEIVGSIPTVAYLTDYTWYSTAHWNLFHYGFFAFAMFGAMYYIIPRLLNETNPSAWAPGLVKAHFGFTLLGVVISSLSLITAGVGEGYFLSDVKNDFAKVMHSTMMPFRMSTLGDLFIFIGTVFFILNFALMLSRHCAACCFAEKTARGKDRK